MATIRSLLRVWSWTIGAPLPPLTVLSARTLSPPLCRRAGSGWRSGASVDCYLAVVCEPDETRGHHALIRLHAAFYDSLRLVLSLHHDRTHRCRVVVLDDIHKSTVWTAL